MNSGALAVIDGGGSYLTQWREPEEVLAEATKAAVALKKVISMKEKPVTFNGEIYLEREDWGTVGKFYGCTAKTTETRYVEFGNERGFEAVAVVIDRNMNEIGRAESMCLSGEDQWGDVPKYEWQDEIDANGKKIWDGKLRGGKGGYKAKKVQIGTVAKPLFQLRSMAQTRAEAKALKGVFSWVVVLAGYKPSVAEEMTGNEHDNQDQEPEKPKPTVQRKSEKAASGFPPMNAAPKPPESKAMCAECRYTDGHAPDCSYSFIPADAGDAYEPPEKGPEPAQQPAKAESDQSREDQWNNFAGHDVKKHINWKQGKLLFMVQSKKGITEEQMKDYLMKNLKVEHRPLIEWKDFQALLDAMDPTREFHQENKK